MGSVSVHSPRPFREEAMDSHTAPDRPCYFCAEETHVYDDCPWHPHPAVLSATAVLHEGAKQPFAKAMGSESVGSSPTPPQQPSLFQEVAALTSGQMGPTAGQVNPIGVAAGYPEVECPCGRGTTVVRTSRTERNPGREFYTCPAMQISQKCGFFLWCDKVGVDPPFGVNSPVKSYQRCGSDSPVKLDQRHNFNSPVSPVRQYAFNTPVKPNWRIDINSPVKFEQQFSVNSPMCACGAGKCRLLIMQDGCDAGRKYFACTVKKGQGACNFFQWYDTATKSLEMKNDNLVYNEAPSFELVPEETKEQRMDESDERDDGASELKPDLEGHEGKDGGPGEANDGTIQEGLQRPDAPVRSSSPPSCRDHKSNHAESDALLIKRLSLHESSPTKVTPRPGKCFRCGNDGHWMSECAAAYVCFKCGKYGHWKKDCTM